MNAESLKLEYLSEVMDSETGEISKPFTIDGKNYQMVRAITPNKERVMGVYCMDEMNEDGSNKIYDIKEFEEAIANKNLKKETNMEIQKNNPNFEGYKHFIVNKESGKARKFKTIEELAKAKMGEGEKYMGVKEFKKFVDETLFGTTRKQNVNEVTPTGQETDEEMNAKAKKLMDMIGKRIPSNIISTIKTNKVAQREVIAAFAELIGVPRNGLSQLIAGIKDIATQQKNKDQEDQQSAELPITENKIIKIKNIRKNGGL